ncbi:hypothetical protein N7481_007431 [Penicillium waksmanii]|uniref:uncharacterized protein n=1 Tax=Penicillium waksmanii TaxID=69791 RepID=UPI002549019B|nr:uncharacterized protein N7481_007431 [Penicillium waksmanii]KAJ5980133.1 hypothetical protein N7481_007431 [Penicillium waksmanii]
MAPSSYSDDSSIDVTKKPTMLKNLRSQSYRVAWRPTLDEVLNNTAPPPYTLSAFTNYLSHNHCLETLEFILEAKRYREHFSSLLEPAKDSIVTPTGNHPTNINLSLLYQILLETYIFPGAEREVNLPVKVRDDLLQNKMISTPPLPETLDLAVRSIRDLIEDSIFDSFLKSASTYIYEEAASRASGESSRSFLSTLSKDSDGQPMEPGQAKSKRPSLMTIGKSWSWPPWS